MANSNDVTVLDATPVVAIVKITSAHILYPFVEVSLSMGFGYEETKSLLGRPSAHTFGHENVRTLTTAITPLPDLTTVGLPHV